MTMTSFSQTTHDITVTVIPEYEVEQSMPTDSYYIWAYHIHIENHSSRTVQLLNRHWVIIDNTGQMQEVQGEGVVGLQPVLHPGEGFEYSSSVHLSTPSGIMMGTYDMMDTENELLEVEIPSFSLDCPLVEPVLN